MVYLMLESGLRVDEVRKTNIQDIEITERKGNIRVIGKWNKERIIPLSSDTRRAINKYLDTRRDNNEALFLSNRNSRISKRMIQTIVENHGFNAHKLRHTFITRLVREGTDFSLIKSLSGHESMDMVARYSKASQEDKENAIKNIFG